MALDTAKSIAGLRAVFGEVYPDPVRVVAVEHDIGQLSADPTNSAWTSASVEFCGGTHITNTADAHEFVITEETAVAKGIRRVTAVTGPEAVHAVTEGARLIGALKELRGKSKPELDEAIGDFRKEVEEAGPSISYLTRSELRSSTETMQKELAAWKKAELNKSLSQGIKALEETLLQLKEDAASFAVIDAGLGTDSQAVKKALEAMKKHAPDTAILAFSEDPAVSGGKVLLRERAPASH